MTRQGNTQRRRGLLASIHIGLKELCIDDPTYREILQNEFGAASAAQLSVKELDQLVQRFVAKGWKSKRKPDGSVRPDRSDGKKLQAAALKKRIEEEIDGTTLTDVRLRGMAVKFCGVESLRWTGDAVRLERLLAVILRMKNAGEI